MDLSRVNGALPIRTLVSGAPLGSSVACAVDGVPLRPAKASSHLSFGWIPGAASLGEHLVTAELRDSGGIVVASDQLSFRTIRSGTPLPSVEALRHMFGATTPVARESGSSAVASSGRDSGCVAQLVLSPAEVTGMAPVRLSVRLSPAAPIERVDYWVNDLSLPTDPANPETAFWDARAEWPGTYNLQAIVTTADRRNVATAVYTVTIRDRLTVASPAGPGGFAAQLVVDISPCEGLHADGVSFTLGGRRATCWPVPASRGCYLVLPSSGVSGNRRLIARVRAPDGASYVSSPLVVQVAPAAPEQPLDVASKPVEVLPSPPDAPVAPPASDTVAAGDLAALRREALTAPAWGARARTGVLGVVNGLCVETLTETYPELGLSTSSEEGQILAVSASIVPGSGRAELLNAEADDYALTAAEDAAALCRRAVSEAGGNVDWSQLDMEVVDGDPDTSIEGNSAGAADAVALVSAALNLPVDDSVAMTGAVDPQGNIRAVGGINDKSLAALSDPSIHTLIIPAGSTNPQELLHVFEAAPHLFSSRRIILASSIEEVLREAIIGYDPGFDEGVSLEAAAARAYDAGRWSEALTDFQQAQALLPEDATIAVWIDLVRVSMPSQ